MATARKSSTTMMARSRRRAGNPPRKEGACLHEAGATWLCALRLCPGDYRVPARRTARRAPGLPGLAWLLRKGEHAMQPTPDDRLSTTHEQLQHQMPSTGPGANKARLETVLPTALFGPAQQGREPCPIILPHIAIGMSVAPNVPALFTSVAAASLALEHRPTLVLSPVTNEGKGQDTGAHKQHPEEEEAAQAPAEPIAPSPKASPGQGSGYPVITTPIPTPSDLHHTTPFPSAPVQHQAHQWSPRHQRLFLAGLGSGLFLYLLALVLVAIFVAPVATKMATVTLVPDTNTLSTRLTVTAL